MTCRDLTTLEEIAQGCPFCGSRKFYVNGESSYHIDFSVNHNGSIEKDEPKVVDAHVFDHIRCSKCLSIIGTYDEWRAAGVHVPIV